MTGPGSQKRIQHGSAYVRLKVYTELVITMTVNFKEICKLLITHFSLVKSISVWLNKPLYWLRVGLCKHYL